MTNSWMNADGEPIMDGAAWRFEQQLDMDSAEERARMQWEDDFYSDYPETCPRNCGFDADEHYDDGECPEDDDDFHEGGEDAWLDGSYEE